MADLNQQTIDIMAGVKPLPDKFEKPTGEMSNKIVWEFPRRKDGRILREFNGGKSMHDYYFEDNWEPVSFYDIGLGEEEPRWVGVVEYTNGLKSSQERIKEAVEAGQMKPVEEKVPEPAPPSPPPAVPAPPPPPANPEECPCKQKLSDKEKGILNFGLSSEMLKNPNAAAIGIARQLGGKNGGRLANLIQQAGVAGVPGQLPTPLTNALPALNRMQAGLAQQQNIVNAFENECKKFTTPQGLMSIVSSLSLFAQLNCALGIEGLDIGVGLNVVNQNGQFQIQAAVAANVDIERVLNQFDSAGQLGTDLATAVQDLQAGLDSAFAALDAVNGALNGIMDQAAAMQNAAADFIQKFTDISALSSLVNEAFDDPCFKIGSTLNGSVISPDFINAVRGGSPTGFGAGAGGFR